MYLIKRAISLVNVDFPELAEEARLAIYPMTVHSPVSNITPTP
jgi:hypothetical protein